MEYSTASESNSKLSLCAAAPEERYNGVMTALHCLEQGSGSLLVLYVRICPRAKERQCYISVPMHGSKDERGAAFIIAAIWRVALVLKHLRVTEQLTIRQEHVLEEPNLAALAQCLYTHAWLQG